jgi:hypothetical protein
VEVVHRTPADPAVALFACALGPSCDPAAPDPTTGWSFTP